MRGNAAMRDLKFWLNYGPNITATIEKFPGILGSSRDVFESVGKDVRGLLDRGEGTLTHGDFWSGKYGLSIHACLLLVMGADKNQVSCYRTSSYLHRGSPLRCTSSTGS